MANNNMPSNSFINFTTVAISRLSFVRTATKKTLEYFCKPHQSQFQQRNESGGKFLYHHKCAFFSCSIIHRELGHSSNFLAGLFEVESPTGEARLVCTLRLNDWSAGLLHCTFSLTTTSKETVTTILNAYSPNQIKWMVNYVVVGINEKLHYIPTNDLSCTFLTTYLSSIGWKIWILYYEQTS